MREIFEIETFELRNSEWKSSYRGIKRLKEHEELLWTTGFLSYFILDLTRHSTLKKSCWIAVVFIVKVKGGAKKLKFIKNYLSSIKVFEILTCKISKIQKAEALGFIQDKLKFFKWEFLHSPLILILIDVLQTEF